MSRSTHPGLGRLAATGYAFVYMVLAVPAVALFSIELTFIPLVLVTVGIVGLLVVVPVVGGLAEIHRRMAARILGVPVRPFYKATQGLGPLRKLQRWAGDPARWRDMLWLLLASTVGWVLAILAVTLFLTIGWYLIYPGLWAITPEGVLDQQLGFMTIDTRSETFLAWGVAAVAFAIWWYTIKPLTRVRARMDAALLSRGRTERLERRVQDLSVSRAETVDHSAAELRRIERDLHDGAQARLVALGMSLGMADDLLGKDPESARQLLAEARSTTTAALGDLRSVVRGIHPPVLADRGLAGAVQALAIDMSTPVTVIVDLPGRPPAPVESAVYFAVAECLANVGKHSGAERTWVELRHRAGVLRVGVGDDGRGGADADNGTGLRGVVRRLAAFDGTMAVSSPAAGPTLITMEVPCALSSPKTTPSSATD